MKKFNLPEELKEYRLRRKWSIRQMADFLSVSRSAYQRMESGYVQPNYEKAMQIKSRLASSKPPTIPWYKSRKLRWFTPIVIFTCWFR